MGPYLQKLYDVALLARPFNALQPMILFVFGVIISGGDLRSSELYIGLIAILLLHSAVTIWNDLSDQVVDKHNNVKTVLTTGYITERMLKYIVLGLAVAGIVLCALFLPLVSVMLAALTIIVGWQYSARPFKASHRPIGSMVFLAISYGAVPLLLGASLGKIDAIVWLFAIAWSFARVSLSLMKDYKDAVGDVKVKKKTFLLRFGHRRVVATSVVCLVVGYGAVIALTTQVVSPAYWIYLIGAGVLCIALFVIERVRLWKASSYQSQHDLFRESLYIHLGVDGALTLWLILLFTS